MHVYKQYTTNKWGHRIMQHNIQYGIYFRDKYYDFKNNWNAVISITEAFFIFFSNSYKSKLLWFIKFCANKIFSAPSGRSPKCNLNLAENYFVFSGVIEFYFSFSFSTVWHSGGYGPRKIEELEKKNADC